jgi:hypothetical protein
MVTGDSGGFVILARDPFVGKIRKSKNKEK